MSYSYSSFQSQRQKNWRRNQNATRYRSNISLGPVANTVIVALMVTVLGLIYLTQATKATSYDYEINRIDTQIEQLAIQKDDLEIENARLASLDTIKGSSVARSMSTPDQVTYLNN